MFREGGLANSWLLRPISEVLQDAHLLFLFELQGFFSGTSGGCDFGTSDRSSSLNCSNVTFGFPAREPQQASAI